MPGLDNLVEKINRVCVCISGTALIFMMMLGFSNVLSRTFWRPIIGTFEIIGFLGALCTAMALGFAQLRKNHVGVDILISHYSRRWRRVTEIISYLITAPFFVIIAWRVAAWGTIIMESGETSETLRIAYYPVVYVVAAGFAFLALILFFDLFKAFRALLHLDNNSGDLRQESINES